MKQLLKGATVVSGDGFQKIDVLIEDETISETGVDLVCGNAKVVDLTGKYLFPGFIDAHTHFDLEVSGTVTADNFYTGTKAAIAGGTTMILDFATQNKGETLAEALENWHKKSDGNSSCDYGFHLAVSDWNEAISEELEQVVKDGITSFKVYMTYDAMVLEDKEIYQVLKRIKELGGIVGVHCENKGIIDALVEEEKAAHNLTPKSHPITRPAEAEAEAIGRLLKIAKVVDTPVIVVHLSTKAGLQEILSARKNGQKVYVETCPQYLLLDDSKYDLPDFESSKYVISPPLRKVEDQSALWNALKEFEIQTIATDHCSFTMAQKEMGREDFTKIPCGMSGVENRPILVYTYGVMHNRIGLERMCQLLSENPAKLYGMYPRKGCIAPGSDADLVVLNHMGKWDMTEEGLANVDYNPFEGLEVYGTIEQVYLRGELVAEHGKVLKEKTGQYIPRNKPSDVK